MAANYDKSTANVAKKGGSRKRRSGPKLRIGLEKTNYEIDFEFPAEAPGRVIVRLERLMGSDKIRITDLKYMATLLQRLEEEEDVMWRKRTWERRKAEYNRFRQLVINGYTEPSAGMEDLTNHPIFRVNRILNRLSKLNDAATPIFSPPPMNPIEPFEEDDTGEIFKSYPGHIQFAQELEMRSRSVSQLYLLRGKASEHHRMQIQESKVELGGKFGEVEVQDLGASAEEKDEEELPHTNYPTSAMESKKSLKRVSILHHHHEHKHKAHERDGGVDLQGPKITLHDIQKKYGIAENVDLGVEWKPYRSELVDVLYSDESRRVLDLYEMCDEIVGVYDREQLTADDYIASMAGYLSSKSITEVPGTSEGVAELEKKQSIYTDLYDDDEFWRYIENGSASQRYDDENSESDLFDDYDDDQKSVDLDPQFENLNMDDEGYDAEGE